MQISLNGKEYLFLKGYQKENKLRAAFDKLAVNTFNLSFEVWYTSGYWNEKYIPYTLFDGDKAVANASVNIMDFNFCEKLIPALPSVLRYIQIGTVMTDENYRHQGLSRFLMQEIFNDWNSQSDLIYLFANHSALDFYPKFGFKPVKEYEYSKSVKKPNNHFNIEKVDMNLQSNRIKFYDYIIHSKIFSKLSLHANADLIMFYCITFMKDHVYYLKSLDAFVIAIFNQNQLQLWDIFCKHEIDLEFVMNSFIHHEIEKVILGFTPLNTHEYEVREITTGDVLFIQENKVNPFDHSKIMFPLFSHA